MIRKEIIKIKKIFLFEFIQEEEEEQGEEPKNWNVAIGQISINSMMQGDVTLEIKAAWCNR